MSYYHFLTLISVTIFSLVHLFAKKLHSMNRVVHGNFLSIAGGVPLAYVFVDLLPKLCQRNIIISNAFHSFFPYLEKHAYFVALLGFLLFFAIAKSPSFISHKQSFWLSFTTYALFNFLIGYAIVDKDNPEVQPLILFTIAMALLYFINDYTLTTKFPQEYPLLRKWILILCLFFGWITGILFVLSPTGIAIVSAFIGGGVIMNVTKHEIPKDNPHSLEAFLIASIGYAVLLLAIGGKSVII